MTPDEVELLSELTIVIPTCNRPLELERAIEYWRDLPVTVHILDGSDKPVFVNGKLPGANNIFIHYFPLEIGKPSMEGFSNRVRIGVSFIETKFGALIGEDDFFTIAGMVEALKVLSENPDVGAVIGKCAFFRETEGKVRWYKSYTSRIPKKSLLSNTIEERLSDEPYAYTSYYTVTRASSLVKIHLAANFYVFADFRVNEHIAHHLGKAYCKTVLLNSYLWLRHWDAEKNPNYEYRIREVSASEKKVLTTIFEDAFKSIEPELEVDEIKRLAAEESRKIHDLLQKKDVKYSSSGLQNKQTVIASHVKELIMGLFLGFPETLRLKIMFFLPSRYRVSIENRLTPEFGERDFFENLLLRPREELRSKANI